MCDQQSLRSACAYAQSDLSLCLSLDYSMIFKLLTKQHMEFLSLRGGCTGSSESTLVKIPCCWKSYVVAHIDTPACLSQTYHPLCRSKLIWVHTVCPYTCISQILLAKIYSEQLKADSIFR